MHSHYGFIHVEYNTIGALPLIDGCLEDGHIEQSTHIAISIA